MPPWRKEAIMRRVLPALLVFLALIAGCSLMPGAGFVAGTTTQAEVRASMGPPGKTYPGPDGGAVWAYTTGPFGMQTWMARFNGTGVLVKFEQVLDQEHFSAIQPGLDGAQVSATIGPPFEEVRFDNIGQVAWDYRYQDVWGYESLFSVMFGKDGKVVSTFNRRLNPGRNGRD
jgi:hypothetical protein